ncbi:energy transducer TonB [Hymenobacter weizhouensis]|uniref:energy transducer TonB n=1 Tax=Hymenobacter sp. YIM 151500-1 TaxID=2987689 RepID=UPI002227FADD|nr:energy transducer TonB [Hymenobacter sp. YIM 151500-1]UYZ61838.1 TonB family protein [Hymenobacter sp. YIM 151500-1]
MTTTAPTPLPSLDDIVFEGRNKAYGAYVLRQQYSSHLRTAVLLATTLAALLIAIPLVVQRLWPAPIQAAAPVIPNEEGHKLMRVDIDQPVMPPAQAKQVVVRPPQSEVPTKVVPNDEAKPVEPSPAVEPIDAPTEVGPVASTGATGNENGAVGGSATGAGDTVAPPAPAPAKMEPFVHVEEMPEFMGGNAALMKYLQRHLRYPMPALREGVSGKVYISFTVNTDGSITDVEVLKGLGYGTDEEASRVIRQMPAWKPGRQNQRAVPVRYNLPITFRYE